MFNAFRHNVQFPRINEHVPVTKINTYHTLNHDKCFVGFRMRVPYKISLYFHNLKLVVIHLSDDLRLPVRVEEGKFIFQINGLIHGDTPYG